MDNFYMNGNNGISILIEGRKEGFTAHKDKSFIDTINNFSARRGNILSIAVSIENLINDHIEYIIFDTKNEGSELFQHLFLKAPYLGFHNKRKIYKELCKFSTKTKHIYQENKLIITDIDKCIKIRNKFAHGQLLYKIETKLFYLEYYSSDGSQQEELNTAMLDTYISLFYECINNINKLVGINGVTKEKVIY